MGEAMESKVGMKDPSRDCMKSFWREFSHFSV